MSDKRLFCGFDTSNYTTSCSVVDSEGQILANIKRPLPVSEGACGLRQSDAVFAHIKNLPYVTAELRSVLDGRQVTAIGVSSKPRDAEDSYMPCFLSGLSAASAAADSLSVPLYRFSHQSGHIEAAYITSGAYEIIGNRPFISFHVSGGTTEILQVTCEKHIITPHLIGGTADLNAGQAIDRTGVALGLKFPCGPALEKLALENIAEIPSFRVPVKETECNLSGLENLAIKLYKETESRELVSAFVLEYVSSVLKKLSENARIKAGNLPIVYAGGVMSNSIIKKRLSVLDNVFFTKPEFSADNAVGIALLCRTRWLNESDN